MEVDRMNIYVGNLSFEVTEDDLRSAFEDFGSVDSVRLITDKYTGRSKGFAFVEMTDNNEAKAAMSKLNDKEFMGRTIKVNEARPRTEGGRGRDRGRSRGRY
jgi:RNA recognition motif-containing protein